MGKSTASGTDILAYIFNKTAFSWDAVTSLDLHLHTADPGIGGTSATSECNYTNYALVTVNRNSGGWTVSSPGGNPQVVNAALIQFPQCGGGNNTATYVSITPHSTTEILYKGVLNSPLAVSNLVQPQFSAGALIFTEA